ncbi:MFS transporter [Corynebacterium tapiri]|nr:MFS transporter [Corynebacterium tapiri]
MSAYQWLIIALACFVNALDGYDLVAMAFTSTAVSAELGLSGSQLGWLFSSALIGIGLGSIFLAPLADQFGRKQLIVASLIINLVGLSLTVATPSFSLLLLFRIITGIGVGGILACVTVLTSEFSNLRYRGLAMSIYASGYGLGATLCGVLSAQLIPTQGWRSIFVVGAALTLLALVLTLAIIPESPETLAKRGQHDRLTRLVHRLGKGEELAGRTPTVRSLAEQPRARARDVLHSDFARVTLALWAAFGLITFGFNYANQWTPKLLTEAGLSAQQGIVGGIMLSFGGTLGSLLYGALTTRFDARRTLITFSLGSAAVLVAFISSTHIPPLMLALGVAVGMLLNGCITGMYTITPQAYPFALRATGVGTAIGISRVGAVLGPLIVGYLVDAGWNPQSLYVGAGVVMLAAAAAVCVARAPR